MKFSNSIERIVMLLCVMAIHFCCIAQTHGWEIKTVSDGGYECIYIVDYIGGKRVKGAKNINGNVIIPLSRGYEDIRFVDTENSVGWYEVKKNGKEGVCDIYGNELISPSKGYELFFFRYDPNTGGYYRFEKNGKMGACDIYGNELISPSKGYDDIYFHYDPITGGIYRVEKDNKYGIYNTDGKEIISHYRGYTFIYFNEVKDHKGYYTVEKNDKFGVCDIDGKEIIPCIYSYVFFEDSRFKYKTENQKVINLDVTLDGQGHMIPVSSYSSTHTSSSSKINNKSASSERHNNSSTSSKFVIPNGKYGALCLVGDNNETKETDVVEVEVGDSYVKIKRKYGDTLNLKITGKSGTRVIDGEKYTYFTAIIGNKTTSIAVNIDVDELTKYYIAFIHPITNSYYQLSIL